MIQVVILGAGNVATHLYKAFQKSENIEVIQVYNHKPERLISFSETSTTTAISELKEAHIYIFALKDDAILEMANIVPDFGALYLHTSGGIGMDALSKFRNHGVFYPLQTFSAKKSVDFTQIPMCLEANSDNNLQKTKELAAGISKKLFETDSGQRKALHASAVFVCNFTNHLYTIGADICQKHDLSFELLKPLIKETAAKIEELSPAEAQTGPAIRNDRGTIEGHLELLTENQKNIYELLTASIYNLHGKKL
ncbi:Rossmann-like and DUF2520 domain-containing protein [Autumnicola psychrophila]|uniref:DUF2520 domain-containing protein n=1 Tax=Autumnicola psychrophila TaxID=3075592 RepID=A0ABU3DVN5_9FLAO|nr:DUF2520 domain-containing protein [Zunongwangia sp. F225]MDT0687784.1 DUF2520 domain-containing protein [Zunongwangia sp. F225]